MTRRASWSPRRNVRREPRHPVRRRAGIRGGTAPRSRRVVNRRLRRARPRGTSRRIGDGTNVRRRTASRLGALERDADEQERSVAAKRGRARSLRVSRAPSTPSISSRAPPSIEDGLTDGAAVAVDASRHVAAVLASPGAFAGRPEGRRVAEGKAEQGESDVHAFVDENPVQILRIDLEVRGRQFDRRGRDVAAPPLDHGATGAAQSAVPTDGDVGPGDDPERTRNGVEGTIAFKEQRRGGDHARRVRVRRDARRASRPAPYRDDGRPVSRRRLPGALHVDAVRSGILAPCANLPFRPSS